MCVVWRSCSYSCSACSELSFFWLFTMHREMRRKLAEILLLKISLIGLMVYNKYHSCLAAESEVRQMSWISQISRGFPTFSLKVNFLKKHTSFGLHVTLELKFVIVGNKKIPGDLFVCKNYLFLPPGSDYLLWARVSSFRFIPIVCINRKRGK